MADRDVLNWRRSRSTPPSVEDFEAKKGYIEQQKQFNKDAIVNGLGNGTLKVGSDEWYASQKKGDKLQEQIDAYNRGMMGVLDGEKAVTREEQAATGATRFGGGYRGNVSLFANNDEWMYVGLNDDEQQQSRAVKRRYDEETQELCINIEQFLLAQADPNKDIDELRGKYPYAHQQMKKWTDQLKVKMGEDAARMFISRCMDKADAKYGGADKPNNGVIPSTGNLVQSKEAINNHGSNPQEPGPMPGPPPVLNDHPDMVAYQTQIDNYWDAYDLEEKQVDEKEEWAEAVNEDIIDETVEYAVGSAVEVMGGQLARTGGSEAIEFVLEGVPYVGMVVECYGQYKASQDTLTALLENYINFGANEWNKEHDNEYRDALVWSPNVNFQMNEDFLKKAYLLQTYF